MKKYILILLLFSSCKVLKTGRYEIENSQTQKPGISKVKLSGYNRTFIIYSDTLKSKDSILLIVKKLQPNCPTKQLSQSIKNNKKITQLTTKN